MSGGVRVLCPEGGAEGVDFSYGCSSEFTFELTAHGKAGLLSEEVLAEVDFAVVHGDIGEVHRGDLEHVARSLSVRLGDEGSVEVDESFVVEEFVDGESHGVTDSEDGTEGVGAESHVGHAPEVFEGGVLLLERISHRVAFSDYLDLLGLDLDGLAATH